MVNRVNNAVKSYKLTILVIIVFAVLVAFFTLRKTEFKTGPLFLFLKEKFLSLFGLGDPNYQAISMHDVLQSGYTLDLVLVAGMWVLYNMFRVIFFVHKVVHDCKNSHEFYRFTTPFPVTIDEEKKPSARFCRFRKSGWNVVALALKIKR